MIYELLRNHKMILFVDETFDIKWCIYGQYAIHHLNTCEETFIRMLNNYDIPAEKLTIMKHDQLGCV